MRRPGPIAAIERGVLIVLGIPAYGIKFTGVDASAIPARLSSRNVDNVLANAIPD